MDVKELIERSNEIRGLYHELEVQQHGSEWTAEEDALAFLTDAALVGRLTMSKEGSWPKGGNTDAELQHKLGECVWWLTILADRAGTDINTAISLFLEKTENMLKR